MNRLWIAQLMIWTLILPAIVSATENPGEGVEQQHDLMGQMLRDGDILNKNLKAMFDEQAQLDAMPSSPRKQQAMADHEARMKSLLHQMTVHMEMEAKMLEEMKAEGLGHEGHHKP